MSKERLFRCPRCKQVMVEVDKDRMRQDFPNSFKPWTLEEDRYLAATFANPEIPIIEIAAHLGRPINAINKRGEMHGLMRRRKVVEEQEDKVIGKMEDPETGDLVDVIE